jgi:nucleotide-binding universal stress UspA family protein
VARNFQDLHLAESEEIVADRAYLEKVKTRLQNVGISAEIELLMGEPADKIVGLAHSCGADLIAMSTHGHRFISDLIYGSTAEKVRHVTEIPVLLLKAPKNI